MKVPPRPLIILLLLGAVSAQARVFWRWGAAAGGGAHRTVEAAGGQSAYAADVTLNGGRARLTVYSFEEGVTDVARRLRTAFPAGDIPQAPAGTMAIGTVRDKGRVLRFVIAGPREQARTTVFMLDQTESEYSRSLKPDPRQTGDLPPYPGATARLTMRDHQARASLTVLSALAPPAAVADFYAAHLSAAGWRQPLPLPAGAPDRAGLLVFEKQGSVCTVYVAPAPHDRETRITVLHKELDIE